MECNFDVAKNDNTSYTGISMSKLIQVYWTCGFQAVCGGTLDLTARSGDTSLFTVFSAMSFSTESHSMAALYTFTFFPSLTVFF